MRLLSLPTLAFVALPVMGSAQDAGGFYLKAFGGASALQGDAFTLDGTPSALNYDIGFTAGGAWGYAYPDSPYRAEIEFSYRSSDATDIPLSLGSDGDFASTSLMINGYYMFPTASDWQPYAGLGLGVLTEIDFDIGGAEFSDRGGVAFQAMLGVEYPLTDNFAIFAEARYFTAGSVDLQADNGSTLSADYDTLDLNIGGAFRF